MDTTDVQKAWYVYRHNAGYTGARNVPGYHNHPTRNLIMPQLLYTTGAAGPYITNLSDYVPTVLYTPQGFTGTVDENFVDRPFVFRLLSKPQVNNQSYSGMRDYRLSTALKQFVFKHFQRTRTGRMRSENTLIFSFMMGVNYDSASEFPQIVWAMVVPYDYAVSYHKRFLNLEPMTPQEFGLEFWYCNERLAGCGVIMNRFFRGEMTDFLGEMNVPGKGKTALEMDSLFTTLTAPVGQYKTLIKKQVAGQSEVVEAIKSIRDKHGWL